MSFQPIVPATGLVGWSFLQRTMETQTAAFETSPQITRDTEYFIENIGKIQSAEELVGDYRLFKVALGAFGLDDHIQDRFFIQKMLEEGTLADDAMANRMTDPRYGAMVDAFGFGNPFGSNIGNEGFADGIIASYTTRQFEIAVGQQDDTMRQALNAVRELEDLASQDISNDAMWYSILGSAPMRSVFETALALPNSIVNLDLDKQVDLFKDRLQKVTGSDEIAQFSSEGAREQIVQRYFLMDQISNVDVMNSSQIALSLLQM